MHFFSFLILGLLLSGNGFSQSASGLLPCPEPEEPPVGYHDEAIVLPTPTMIDESALAIFGDIRSFEQPPSINDIEALWSEFTKRHSSVAPTLTTNTIGVCYRTGKHWNYVTGFVVRGNNPQPINEVPVVQLHPQTYAVFRHHGRIAQVPNLRFHIQQVWMPDSGYQHAQAPDLEIYPEGVDQQRDLVMEVWVPIEKTIEPE